MNKLSEKLKSKTGSSLIIALLFTMVCVFVGGAVLVSASVNGGRLNGRREREQGILNQRSLASLIAGQLEAEKGNINFAVQIKNGELQAPADNSSVVKKAIFDAAKQVYDNSAEGHAEFTATYPDGTTETCTVKCGKDYETRISFAEQTAQIELILRGRRSSNEIVWYGCEIVKAVNE